MRLTLILVVGMLTLPAEATETLKCTSKRYSKNGATYTTCKASDGTITRAKTDQRGYSRITVKKAGTR